MEYEIYHAAKKNSKYVAKVGKGKDARYFYTQAEYAAYLKSKRGGSGGSFGVKPVNPVAQLAPKRSAQRTVAMNHLARNKAINDLSVSSKLKNAARQYNMQKTRAALDDIEQKSSFHKPALYTARLAAMTANKAAAKEQKSKEEKRSKQTALSAMFKSAQIAKTGSNRKKTDMSQKPKGNVSSEYEAELAYNSGKSTDKKDIGKTGVNPEKMSPEYQAELEANSKKNTTSVNSMKKSESHASKSDYTFTYDEKTGKTVINKKRKKKK